YRITCHQSSKSPPNSTEAQPTPQYANVAMPRPFGIQIGPSLLCIENPFPGKIFSWMSDSPPQPSKERQYPTSELVRRLLGLAWQFRVDCLLSLALGIILLLLVLVGLQLLGVVIDV